MKTTIRAFLKLESAGGIALVLAAALAMVVANSPAQRWYALLLDVPVEVRIGALYVAKPLILWINDDGLMAIFFFLVGLELKREFLDGELSRPANILLPVLGAVGGIVFPVGVCLLLNHGDTTAMDGWAIPAATDIAFALGILMLLGNRVPTSLKIFLVSLAIFDDLAAILIIAFFFCWAAIRLGIASLPKGANWASLYGVAVLCGVGFTMSLFVASLAFEGSGTDMHTVFDERLGIIAGSLASGILGYLVLRRALPESPAAD
ncbi:MAG: Na+/H+ antiporter NhaA [Woeseiaceae bacterium]|nr:Na+/H+ antiporter NhaA [Woeseiaceae bacterium]